MAEPSSVEDESEQGTSAEGSGQPPPVAAEETVEAAPQSAPAEPLVDDGGSAPKSLVDDAGSAPKSLVDDAGSVPKSLVDDAGAAPKPPAPSRPPRVIDMRRPRSLVEKAEPSRPPPSPRPPLERRPVERRRTDERPARRAFPEVAAPPAPAHAASAPQARPERARPVPAPQAPAVLVRSPPAPPSAPDPVWIPPARPAHPRKKKASLTPKEALRAKVQGRAVKQAGRTAAPAEPGEVEVTEASLAGTAEVADEPSSSRVRAAARPRRAAPAPPIAPSEEPTPPPAKPGFFQRLLGVFRRRKPPER